MVEPSGGRAAEFHLGSAERTAEYVALAVGALISMNRSSMGHWLASGASRTAGDMDVLDRDAGTEAAGLTPTDSP